jgi:hypothetical protein
MGKGTYTGSTGAEYIAWGGIIVIKHHQESALCFQDIHYELLPSAG